MYEPLSTSGLYTDDTWSDQLDDEVQSRTAQDLVLDTKLNTEIQSRTVADTNLQTQIDNANQTRLDTDTNLQTQIDTEIQSRTVADTNLQTQLTQEATTRANADTLLQSKIDEINAKAYSLTQKLTAMYVGSTAYTAITDLEFSLLSGLTENLDDAITRLGNSITQKQVNLDTEVARLDARIDNKGDAINAVEAEVDQIQLTLALAPLVQLAQGIVEAQTGAFAGACSIAGSLIAQGIDATSVVVSNGISAATASFSDGAALLGNSITTVAWEAGVGYTQVAASETVASTTFNPIFVVT